MNNCVFLFASADRRLKLILLLKFNNLYMLDTYLGFSIVLHCSGPFIWLIFVIFNFIASIFESSLKFAGLQSRIETDIIPDCSLVV